MIATTTTAIAATRNAPIGARGGDRPRRRRRSAGLAGTLAALLAGGGILAGCGDDEVAWEATRGAVGASEGDQILSDDQWREIRTDVARGIQAMDVVLERMRDDLPPGGQGQVEDLRTRIDALQRELPQAVDLPPGEARETREAILGTFEDLRRDVDGLLTRLGREPRERAVWQDISVG